MEYIIHGVCNDEAFEIEIDTEGLTRLTLPDLMDLAKSAIGDDWAEVRKLGLVATRYGIGELTIEFNQLAGGGDILGDKPPNYLDS